MRLPVWIACLALGAGHAHNYRVVDPKAEPAIVGIAAFPSAAVEVAPGPLDHFSLTAGPGGAFAVPSLGLEPETSLAMHTFVNVAYGIAGQIKRRK